MSKLDFSMNVDASVEQLMKLATDYENYKNYLPQQIKDIKIIESSDDEIVTEAVLVFSSILKKEMIVQSLHKKIDNNTLYTKIISGPAKGTEVTIYFISGKQTKISLSVDLKLSFKAKFLGPLVKKQYKRLLTGIFLKMNTTVLEGQKTNFTKI